MWEEAAQEEMAMEYFWKLKWKRREDSRPQRMEMRVEILLEEYWLHECWHLELGEGRLVWNH